VREGKLGVGEKTKPQQGAREKAGLEREKRESTSLEKLRAGTPGATVAGKGLLKDIYFDFDRYDLTEESRASLRENAEWLSANPQSKVDIERHADERGTGVPRRQKGLMDFQI
jgi:outer membrane protein OmpA-like peptidoglycan-associated protein